MHTAHRDKMLTIDGKWLRIRPTVSVPARIDAVEDIPQGDVALALALINEREQHDLQDTQLQ